MNRRIPRSLTLVASCDCETVKDLDQLCSDLGMEGETPDGVMHSVCQPELPDAGEVWDDVAEKSGEWLDLVRGAMQVWLKLKRH